MHTAQLTYALTCGYGLYASSFPDLGRPGRRRVSATGSDLGPTPLKSGYKYHAPAGPSGPSGLVDCNGGATSTEYYVTAEPLTVGGTGYRAFASNQANTSSGRTRPASRPSSRSRQAGNASTPIDSRSPSPEPEGHLSRL